MNHEDYDAYQNLQDASEARFMELHDSKRLSRENYSPPAIEWATIIAGIAAIVATLIILFVSI